MHFCCYLIFSNSSSATISVKFQFVLSFWILLASISTSQDPIVCEAIRFLLDSQKCIMHWGAFSLITVQHFYLLYHYYFSIFWIKLFDSHFKADKVIFVEYMLFWKHINFSLSLLNWGQCIYNFYFVLQGSIDRIDYFHRIASLRNLLLIGF